MKVYKFGGSSIGNKKGFEQIFEIISKEEKQNHLIVVSACGKTTDLLIEAARFAENQKDNYLETLAQIKQNHMDLITGQFTHPTEPLAFLERILAEITSILKGIYQLGEFSNRTYDKLVSYGEFISSHLLTYYFHSQDLDAVWIRSQDIIKTEDKHTDAKVRLEESYTAIQNYVQSGRVYIMSGFVGADSQGNTTTIGRGGSDYTAAIVAAAVQAEDLIIWTDVSGMMTADPRIVKNANILSQLSYGEALELCHFGAKVLYPPTIIPAIQHRIPIKIKNTFRPQDLGTLILNESDNAQNVTGLSSMADVCSITLEGSGMIGVPGFISRIFGALAAAQINVIMVTQASSEHGITLVILPEDAEKAISALEENLHYELNDKIIDPIIAEKNLSVLAVVGSNMKNYHGIAGRMFHILGRNGVNIRAIAQGSSENNITTVIGKNDLQKAMNVLHEEFFEEQIKQLNLFVVGVGTVGEKLLEQIRQQQKYLFSEAHLKINVVAVANSRKMYFEEGGISLAEWEQKLAQGEKMNLNQFTDKIKKLNLRNSIFVDNTAHISVADCYEECLSHGIGVVTCNKIASSSEYERYRNLKNLAKKYKAPYLFETNVGAGLPIIHTLNDLIKSGDQIRGIKAVLSGSLNFIMNNFKSGTRFVDIVKQAMELGYTEPDPRIDLSGLDVKRKILILLREAGYQFDLEDIRSKSFLGDEYFETETVEEFLTMLEQNGADFDQLREDAESEGKRLKIVASYENGEAVVGLEKVDSLSPYYELAGSDNIVLFYTDRYREQPMIIKGAGAGADVTASGVFADIMRAGKL